MKRAENLAQSFRFAFQGLWYALNTQRNMRLHLLSAATVLALGWVLRLPRREFIVVLAVIMVVMVAEMLNTAIEATVDLSCQEIHPLAQIAKDVAAGAVLLGAMGAAALGLWVFFPELARMGPAVRYRWEHSPLTVIFVVIGLGLVILFVVRLPTNQHRHKGGKD